jgi:hypothetical protein
MKKLPCFLANFNLLARAVVRPNRDRRKDWQIACGCCLVTRTGPGVSGVAAVLYCQQRVSKSWLKITGSIVATRAWLALCHVLVDIFFSTRALQRIPFKYFFRIWCKLKFVEDASEFVFFFYVGN